MGTIRIHVVNVGVTGRVESGNVIRLSGDGQGSGSVESIVITDWQSIVNGNGMDGSFTYAIVESFGSQRFGRATVTRALENVTKTSDDPTTF
jgi:hypothetical protein